MSSKIEVESFSTTDKTIKAMVYTANYCDKWQYSINDSDWVTYSEQSANYAQIVIENLSPRTEYRIKIRAKKAGSIIYYTSDESLVKTKNASYIIRIQDLYVDDLTPKLNINMSVSSNIYRHKLFFRKQKTLLFTIETTLLDGENVIELTEEQREIMLKSIPNVKQSVMSVDLYVYEGDSLIESDNFATFNAKTSAENSAPIFENFTYEDINEKTTDLTGNNQILISTVSQLRINIEQATAKNHSTIAAYTVGIGSLNVTASETTVDIGIINLTNSVPIVVTAIDSRGYTSILTKTVNFIPYTNVEITNVEISRINDVSEASKITIEGKFSPIVINGVDLNYIKYIHYSTKKTSDTEYENYKVKISDFEQENNSFRYTNNEWITFNEDNSYNVLVRVVDALSNNDDYSAVIPPSKPLLSLRKGKVGVNNKNPQYAVDVDGDINLTGKIYINGEEYNTEVSQ